MEPFPYYKVYMRREGSALRRGLPLKLEVDAALTELNTLSNGELNDLRRYTAPVKAVSEVAILAARILTSSLAPVPKIETWEEAVSVLGGLNLHEQCKIYKDKLQDRNMPKLDYEALEAWQDRGKPSREKMEGVTVRRLPVVLTSWLLALLKYGTHLKVYRDEPGSESALRLESLKERVKAAGVRCKEYDSKEELGELIREDWGEILDAEHPLYDRAHPQQGHKADVDSLSPSPGDNMGRRLLRRQGRDAFGVERAAHESFAETRRAGFVLTSGARDSVAALTAHAQDSVLAQGNDDVGPVGTEKKNNRVRDEPVLLLCGESGVGKTSVIANWVQETRKRHPNVPIISHYVGSSAHSTDLEAALTRITEELISARGDESISADHDGDGRGPARPGDSGSVLESLLKVSEAGPCILVIDGCDPNPNPNPNWRRGLASS